MEPSETLNGHARIVFSRRHSSFPIPKGRSYAQTRFLASPASSFSSPFSSPGIDSRIPFSWEKIPGVPKKQAPKKEGHSPRFLPLPPPTTPASSKIRFDHVKMKNPGTKSFQMDPFLVALVECSKDDDYEETIVGYVGPKITRSLSDRFGFVKLSASCKSTSCLVSESIVPSPRRSNYNTRNSLFR
ncbi:hypothetical protein CK203_030440 [Vitis vinifera]|uniref:Uncharacterized protein n=1 Tax=Vitis vinifera TaxID=29760 RepID=A0A438JDI0_VITVI|nr:hypothetical protein CK203_030440 [Vitis vinifera]